MFSKKFKLLFVATAYTPILFIWWAVSIYNILITGGKIEMINCKYFKMLDLMNKTNLIFLFLILLVSCWFILHLAKSKLTRNKIEIKSIKSADLNMNGLILSYFLPCIELYKKDTIYLIGWLAALSITIFINKGTYFYNPVIKMFGFRYFEIATKKEVTYLMISEKKLINPNDVMAYSQLTDYVILNATK